MKILIYGINYSPELTGIGKYTGEMAEWFASQGYDVSMITAMPYYPEWKVNSNYRNKLWFKEVLNGVTVYRCPLFVPKKVNTKKRIIHELSFVLSSFFYWTPFFFRKKYDLVISISPPFHLGILPYLYSKIKRVRMITHIQDLQIDAAKDLNMLKSKKILDLMFKFENFLLRKSTFVSTLTNGMKKKILSKQIPPEKILLLPNWVDFNSIKPLDKESSLRRVFSIPMEDKVVLYSGNLGKKQGIEDIISVAEQLIEKKNIHFIIVGSGVEKANLEQLVYNKKLTNVRFFPLQPYDKLPALLAIADVHLVLQRKEASDLVMPSKLTTILAVGGCSIITASLGSSLYEVVNDNNMGILIEPDDLGELKKAVLYAIEHDSSALKQNALNYAKTFLDKNIILENFICSIKNV